jgi:4-hydroxybenzoate polyprenyltransferase
MVNNDSSSKKKISIFFTEIIRINDVAAWFVVALLGFILGIPDQSFNKYFVPFLGFSISVFCAISFTFSINNYYDTNSDKNNPRRRSRNALALGSVSKQSIIIINLIFLVIPIIACLLLVNIPLIILCLLILFMGWAYSAPPLRLKSRPIIDIVWHFFGFFFLVLWGSLFANQMKYTIFLVAISLGIFSCIFQIYNHILDYDWDRTSGTTTFAVWAGHNTTQTMLTIVTWIHIIVIIPVILIYSVHFISTIVIVLAGVVVGIYKLKPKGVTPIKKYSLIAFIYYVTISVYVSCILYHILFIMNFSPLHIFDFLLIK